MPRLSIEQLSILLLEPSLTQRKIIASKLRAVGKDNVELAADPDAAWRSMCALTPDLVMSSMYFGKGTGSELLERTRASDDLNEVPFMLISSEHPVEKLDAVKQADVMAILPKLFSVDNMRLALEATAEYITYDDQDHALFEGDSIKVLVVDDSLTARNHIRRLLTDMGMENITLARDGLEAVKVLEDALFDIVITDFNMLEMDGERLTSYIRNRSNQSSIPILMVTSEENEARLDSVMKSGVSAICDKPFNASHVKNLLSQLLR